MTKSLLHLAADRYAAQYDLPPTPEELLKDLTYFDGLAHYSADGEALLQSLRSGNMEAELIRAIEWEISPPCPQEPQPNIGSEQCSGER